MQPTHSSMLFRISGSDFAAHDDIRNGEAAAGLQHAKCFAKDAILVGGKIDDAIRDDDIDRIVGKRNVLDLAVQKLDVFDAGLALVFVGEREHFVGHVEAVGFAGWADAPRREQHVDAAARAEIEHGFARFQFGQRRRIAAAERGVDGFGGNLAGLRGVVKIRCDRIAAVVAGAPQQPPVGDLRAARLARIFPSPLP